MSDGGYEANPSGDYYWAPGIIHLCAPTFWGPSTYRPLDWKARLLAFFGVHMGPQ